MDKLIRAIEDDTGRRLGDIRERRQGTGSMKWVMWGFCVVGIALGCIAQWANPQSASGTLAAIVCGACLGLSFGKEPNSQSGQDGNT